METTKDRLHRIRNVIHGVKSRGLQDLHLFISDAEFLLTFAKRIEDAYQMPQGQGECFDNEIALKKIKTAFEQGMVLSKDPEGPLVAARYYLFPREVVGLLLSELDRVKGICDSLASRCAAQSEVLTQRAEKANQGLRSEIERLKEGKFTPEELHNPCHNLSSKDRIEFEKGCKAYQDQLFGKEQDATNNLPT